VDFLAAVCPVRGVPVVDGLTAASRRDRVVGPVRVTSTISLASSGRAAPRRCLRRAPVANVRSRYRVVPAISLDPAIVLVGIDPAVATGPSRYRVVPVTSLGLVIAPAAIDLVVVIDP
jgi:hypothetical protein